MPRVMLEQDGTRAATASRERPFCEALLASCELPDAPGPTTTKNYTEHLHRVLSRAPWTLPRLPSGCVTRRTEQAAQVAGEELVLFLRVPRLPGPRSVPSVAL